jgi:hypothetical protein
MIKLSKAISKRLGQGPGWPSDFEEEEDNGERAQSPCWLALVKLKASLRQAQIDGLACSKIDTEAGNANHPFFKHLPDVDTRIQDALTMVEDEMASYTP